MPDNFTDPKPDKPQSSSLKPENTASIPTPSISIDWDFYADFLKEIDMTDDEKHEFLEALLSIIIGFVDLGFNIHPAQLATKEDSPSPQDCESIAGPASNLVQDMLNSSHANKLSPNTAEAVRSE